MRFFTTITLAVTSLVSASPAEIEKRGLNNFDQYDGLKLNQVNSSFGANGGLYYKGLGLANIFDNGRDLQGVSAHSIPNVLAFGQLDKLQDQYPYITSKYQGSSGTFDLESFYFGCVSGNSAGQCTITLAGYRNGTRVAGQMVDYRPSIKVGVPMVQLRLDSTWRNMDSVRFTALFEKFSGLGGVAFLDDIRYTYFS